MVTESRCGPPFRHFGFELKIVCIVSDAWAWRPFSSIGIMMRPETWPADVASVADRCACLPRCLLFEDSLVCVPLPQPLWRAMAH